MSVPSPLFARQRSGYARSFSALDVFVFNVMGFALGLAISTNPPFIGSFAPSADVVWVLILGAFLAVLNGLTYGWFAGAIPATGGDFVFVSRSLNHRLGFITSWGFTWCQIYALGLNLGWILSVGIAPALITLGVSLQMPAVVQYGVWLAAPSVTAIGSVFLLLAYYFIAYFEVGLNRLLVYTLFAIGLFGPLLMAWALYTQTNGEFVQAFNEFMLKFTGVADSYNSAISFARKEGMAVDATPIWKASLQAVPLGFLCFLGFTYSVYVGGEVEEPKKSQMWGIILALCVGIIAFVFCMGRYAALLGQEFHSALGFPTVQEQLRLPANSMNFILGMVIGNPYFNAALQLGNLIWFLLVPYVILQVCSHNLIAWTGDYLMPQQLKLRSNRTGAPWVAHMVVCFAAVLFVLEIYFFGINLVGAVALAALAFFLTGLGAWNLPDRRPDIFENSPAVARIRLLGTKTLFQVIGLLSSLCFAWVIYAAIAYPQVANGSTFGAIAVLVIVYGTGLIVYQVGTGLFQRRGEEVGLDLDEFFKQIPDD